MDRILGEWCWPGVIALGVMLSPDLIDSCECSTPYASCALTCPWYNPYDYCACGLGSSQCRCCPLGCWNIVTSTEEEDVQDGSVDCIPFGS